MRMNGKVAREHRIYFNFSHKYKFDLSLVKFHHFSSLLSSMDSHKRVRGCVNAEVGIAGSFCLFLWQRAPGLLEPHTFASVAQPQTGSFDTKHITHRAAEDSEPKGEKKRNGNSRERKKKSYSTFFLFSSEVFFLLLLSLFIHYMYGEWKLTKHSSFIHCKSPLLCVCAILLCWEEGKKWDDERFPISVLNSRLLFASLKREPQRLLTPFFSNAMIYFLQSRREWVNWIVYRRRGEWEKTQSSDVFAAWNTEFSGEKEM